MKEIKRQLMRKKVQNTAQIETHKKNFTHLVDFYETAISKWMREFNDAIRYDSHASKIIQLNGTSWSWREIIAISKILIKWRTLILTALK